MQLGDDQVLVVAWVGGQRDQLTVAGQVVKHRAVGQGYPSLPRTIFALRADTAYRMMSEAGRTGMRIGMRPGRGTAIGTGFGDRSGDRSGAAASGGSPDQIGGDRAEVGVYPRMRTGHAGDLFL